MVTPRKEQPMQEVTIKFSRQEIQKLVLALSKLPNETDTYGLMNKIKHEANKDPVSVWELQLAYKK